jgi:hypothetical protein
MDRVKRPIIDRRNKVGDEADRERFGKLSKLEQLHELEDLIEEVEAEIEEHAKLPGTGIKLGGEA